MRRQHRFQNLRSEGRGGVVIEVEPRHEGFNTILPRPSIQPCLITLTTDFGTRDHFVAAMKGVILGIAPRARIVDITHQITAFEVDEAAFTIAEASALVPQGNHPCGGGGPGRRLGAAADCGGGGWAALHRSGQRRVHDASRPGGPRPGAHKVREITNAKMMLPTSAARSTGATYSLPRRRTWRRASRRPGSEN